MRTRQWAERMILKHGTLAEAFVALICARICVLLGFRTTMSWALRRTHAGQRAHPHLERRIRWAIGTAGQWMPGDKGCLPNAIAAKAMLARRGVASTIHLGVGRHSNGAMHAHAWLEVGGSIVTGGSGRGGVREIVR